MILLLHLFMLLHVSCAYPTQQCDQSVPRLIAADTAGYAINTYRQWLDSSDALWTKTEMVNTYLQKGRLHIACI